MSRSNGLEWQRLGTLPLPVAQLYQSARNAKNLGDRHSNAYYVWEAGLKLLATRCVLAYCYLPDRDPATLESLRVLAHPGIGSLWGVVKTLLPLLAEHDPFRFGPLAERLTTGQATPGLPQTATLHQRIGEHFKQPGRGKSDDAVCLRDVFDRLTFYRNKTFGHGAIGRWGDAETRAFADGLLAANEELHRIVDPLAGGRLVYLENVTLSSGGAEVNWHDLTGPVPQRLEPLRLKRHAATELDGDRVYLWVNPGDGDVRLLLAHPFLFYELRENRFWILNGRQGKRNVELLSYTDGSVASLGGDGGVEAGQSFTAEERARFSEDQIEFFGRLFGRSIDQHTVEDWARAAVGQEELGEKATPDEPAKPSQFIGEFEVREELSRTPNSLIYRAGQPSVGREVALKVHQTHGDEAAQKRFIREARTLGRVSHPNLARIFVVGVHCDRFYYAMELVRGPDLDRVWKRLATAQSASELTPARWCELCRLDEAPMSGAPAEEAVMVEPITSAFLRDWTYYRQVADLARQCAEALHVLHEAEVVHRDVKPGNILMTSQGSRAILADLGSARDLCEDPQARATIGPSFVGTPQYASPEQVADARSVDRRTDIYSLGVVIWEFLTRRRAYEADSIQRVLQLVATKLLDIPSTIEPTVPRSLEAIALKCIQRDPDLRYQTAKDLADDLLRFLEGDPVQAEPATSWYRLRRFVRFRRKPLLAAAGIVGVFAMLSAVALYFGLREDPMVTLRRQEVTRRVEALSRSKPRLDREPPHAVTKTDEALVVNYEAFHILEDHRVIYLRAWQPGDSGVAMARHMRVVKTREANEMVFEGRTSGRDLFIRCVLPNPQTAQLVHSANKVVATQAMKARHLIVDVSDLPIHEEFDVRTVSTFWGSLQKPEDRWFGVIGYEGSLKITILMLFPENLPYKPPPGLNVAESRNSPMQSYRGPKILLEDPAGRWLYWEVPYPKDNHVYRVDWDW